MGERPLFVTCGFVGLVALMTGCGAERRVDSEEAVRGKDAPLVSTYIGDYVEIDETTGGGDANLILDGTNQQPQPLSATDATWTDWTNISPTGHRFLDVSDPDVSSFPRSIGCVGTSKVLSKMDLTYVGLANNRDYAYFAVQRANNNGDAGYYWLMTRKAPKQLGPVAPCKEGESLLEYEISPDDVLLAGHFQPSAEPLLRVFKAQKSATLDAVAAIDFTDTSLWQQDTTSVAAVAVNTSNTTPGAWGAAGVAKQALAPNGDLTPLLLAEAAVKTSLFTGGSICGVKFFGTVITRSSGSGGTSPDLKDFFGPEEFSFGSVTAAAKLTPTCDLEFGYEATGNGLDGTPLGSPACAWTFFDEKDAVVGTSSVCKQSFAPQLAGAYYAKVTVTEISTTCSAEVTTAKVKAFPKLAVTASLAATCTRAFTYDAVASGGTNPAAVSYAWSFPGDTTPASSTTKSGTVAVGSLGVEYTGEVVVTDARTDITCTASGLAKATPLAPLTINLTPSAAPLTCASGLSTDAVTYVAHPAGGNGSYQVSWEGFACPDGLLCTIDPPDDQFCAAASVRATVKDTSGLCGATASEIESYNKVTTVSASNN